MNYATVQSLRGDVQAAIAAAIDDGFQGPPWPEYLRASLEALLLKAAEIHASTRGLPDDAVPELMDVALRAMGEWPGTAESTGGLM